MPENPFNPKNPQSIPVFNTPYVLILFNNVKLYVNA